MYKEEYKQQAYPNVWDSRHRPEFEPLEGMTLLDHFAGLAMQGQIAEGSLKSSESLEAIADWSYKQAAAMMEKRKKYLQQ